jgi:2,3-bisphosphoglycerate-independent phosphoglycerate mutase
MPASRKPSSVILFFIDGLGIGEAGDNNPLYSTNNIEPLGVYEGNLNSVILDGIVVPTDPRLGVDGRPQSASGQTTILTGVNAPKVLGYHKQGFPNEKLRDVLKENSIFLQLDNLGIGPNIFVNTYTPHFFSGTPRWKSATTCAVEASTLQFRRIPDLLGRKAIFHDFTNRGLQQRGFDVPIFSPIDAAEILANFQHQYRFILYEHFITDKLGHDMDHERARQHLPKLAKFIRETLERLDLHNTTFILTSDHGNIEDLSVRNHTLNNVPTIIWGRRKVQIAKEIKDLTDITPAVIKLLTDE